LVWSIFHWRKCATLYLHFPCFDGIVSGVLTALFLEKSRGWKFKAIQPVNYSLQKGWLNTPLPQRSAVVDFLFHPQAGFWADHHPTTFLNDGGRAKFEQNPHRSWIYDRSSGSCAALLWRTVGKVFEADQRLKEMVDWAQKIDSASYDSVEEALSSNHAALVLNGSLAINADQEYCEFLVTQLQRASLQEIVQTDDVQKRFRRARELGELGLDRVCQSVRLEGDVAVFEASSDGVLMNRYAPYCFYPKALYSIGITHSKHSTVVTAMRNPWLNFESLHLGEFMRPFGGGGHQRVGSVVLKGESAGQAHAISERLLQKLGAANTVNKK